MYGTKYSHPVLTSRMALELTGIQFESRDLFPGLHGAVARAKGFSARTVPALEIHGCKVQGSLAIAREWLPKAAAQQVQPIQGGRP
jgi:glutathione S-transferase